MTPDERALALRLADHMYEESRSGLRPSERAIVVAALRAYAALPTPNKQLPRESQKWFKAGAAWALANPMADDGEATKAAQHYAAEAATPTATLPEQPNDAVGRVEGPTESRPYKHFIRLREPRDNEVGCYLFAHPVVPTLPVPDKTLVEEVSTAINRHSRENASNTPDFILAQFMETALVAFETATQQRETWYGRDARPSVPHVGAPPAPLNHGVDLKGAKP